MLCRCGPSVTGVHGPSSDPFLHNGAVKHGCGARAGPCRARRVRPRHRRPRWSLSPARAGVSPGLCASLGRGQAGPGRVRAHSPLFSGDAAGGSPDGDSEPACTGQGTGSNGAASLTSPTVPVQTNTALPKDTDPAAPARVRSRARPGPAPHHRHRRARGAGASPGGGRRRTVGTGVAGGGVSSPTPLRMRQTEGPACPQRGGVSGFGLSAEHARSLTWWRRFLRRCVGRGGRSARRWREAAGARDGARRHQPRPPPGTGRGEPGVPGALSLRLPPLTRFSPQPAPSGPGAGSAAGAAGADGADGEHGGRRSRGLRRGTRRGQRPHRSLQRRLLRTGQGGGSRAGASGAGLVSLSCPCGAAGLGRQSGRG